VLFLAIYTSVSSLIDFFPIEFEFPNDDIEFHSEIFCRLMISPPLSFSLNDIDSPIQLHEFNFSVQFFNFRLYFSVFGSLAISIFAS
jgi:hypothetical protein